MPVFRVAGAGVLPISGPCCFALPLSYALAALRVRDLCLPGARSGFETHTTTHTLAYCCGYLSCIACDKALTEEYTRTGKVPQRCVKCKRLHRMRMTEAQDVQSLHRLADRENHADAQFALGIMYRDGSHGIGACNNALAVKLLERACRQGQADACIRLAEMLLYAEMLLKKDFGKPIKGD